MTVGVLWLLLTVPRVGLQFVIVVFPDHTYFFHINQRHHVSLERFFDLTICKAFRKCFNVENIIIPSLNTMPHTIVKVWLS